MKKTRRSGRFVLQAVDTAIAVAMPGRHNVVLCGGQQRSSDVLLCRCLYLNMWLYVLFAMEFDARFKGQSGEYIFQPVCKLKAGWLPPASSQTSLPMPASFQLKGRRLHPCQRLFN